MNPAVQPSMAEIPPRLRPKLLAKDVIRRAVKDARGKDLRHCDRAERSRALHWLTTPSASKDFWCDLADESPTKLTRIFSEA